MSSRTEVQLLLLATVGLAFGVFALRSLISGKQVSARIQKQGSSPLLGHFPMEFAYWVLKPLGDAAANLRISPNVLSWLCLGLGFLAGVAAALGKIALAGGLSIISALFDSLDGMVARKRGIASDAGEVLDAAVDRYTEFFFLAGLTIYYRFEPWAMLLVLLALAGSYMVSYTQAKADSLGAEVPKGWMRRPERAAYLGGGAFLAPIIADWFELGPGPLLYYPLLLSVLLVAILGNASAIHRSIVLYDEMKERHRRKG